MDLLKRLFTVLLLLVPMVFVSDLSFAGNSQGYVSESITSAFLNTRKKGMGADNKKEIEEKIFHTSQIEAAHDVKMSIKREGSDATSIVLITTTVQGSIEDFEGKNILKSEEGLLKYIIIKAYLTSCAHSGAKKWTSSLLDDHTKVAQTPLPMIRKSGSGMFESYVESPDRRWMQLTTVFSAAEFNDLLKKYSLIVE